MVSDNENDKITTEEADRSLEIESWKLSKLKSNLSTILVVIIETLLTKCLNMCALIFMIFSILIHGLLLLKLILSL